MSDKHPVRNGVIATVVGGIILAILQQVWAPVRSLLAWLWNTLTGPIPVPAFVFIALLGLSFVALLKIRSRRTPVQATALPAMPSSHAEAPLQLPDFETSVLERIARADGEAVYQETLVRSLKTSRIRLQAAIDRLEGLELVEVYSDYEDDDRLFLTARGRRYVVDRNIA